MPKGHRSSRSAKPEPRTPDLTVPNSRAAWERDRRSIRTKLHRLLGRLPARPSPPQVDTLWVQERPGCLLEKFRFENGAGATVPGYLLLPKNRRGKVPAVLYCHWHGGDYDIGKEEILRTHAVPVAPGLALARRGYAVLTIDAYCFGDRNGQGPAGSAEEDEAGEMSAAKYNLWIGRTLWGMILRDDLMAFDYLCTRPEIDAGRVGVTGISMGATRAWWLMALEERIRTGVAVCCLTRYQDLIEARSLASHGIYFFVPGMLNHFDTEAVVALAAPRPLLCQSGAEDPGSPVNGIVKIEQAVGQIYRLYGKRPAFKSVIVPGVGHDYTLSMWKETVAWLDRHLRRA